MRLTSSRTRLSPVGPIPVSAVLRVAQIRRSSALENTAEVEVSEETARILSGVPGGAGALEARARRSGEGGGGGRGRSPRSCRAGYRVATWRERNAPLAFALRLEKVVIFVTVALVIVVAALNIVSNIALTVVEKKRDLGVLTVARRGARLAAADLPDARSVDRGPSARRPASLLGVGLSVAADRFRLVPLPADVYMLTHVPFAVHPGEVAASRRSPSRRRSRRPCCPRAPLRAWRRARRSGCRDDSSGTSDARGQGRKPLEDLHGRRRAR